MPAAAGQARRWRERNGFLRRSAPRGGIFFRDFTLWKFCFYQGEGGPSTKPWIIQAPQARKKNGPQCVRAPLRGVAASGITRKSERNAPPVGIMPHRWGMRWGMRWGICGFLPRRRVAQGVLNRQPSRLATKNLDTDRRDRVVAAPRCAQTSCGPPPVATISELFLWDFTRPAG